MVYFMFISLLQLYVASMHSYLTCMLPSVCKYPNVIRIYSCGVLVKITFELQYILTKLIPPDWQHLKVPC